MISDLQIFNRAQLIHFSKEWIRTSMVLTLCLFSGIAVAETSAFSVIEPTEPTKVVAEPEIITESEALKDIDYIETNQEQHLPVEEDYTKWEMKDVEQIDDKIEKKNVLQQEVTTKKIEKRGATYSVQVWCC